MKINSEIITLRGYEHTVLAMHNVRGIDGSICVTLYSLRNYYDSFQYFYLSEKGNPSEMGCVEYPSNKVKKLVKKALKKNQYDKLSILLTSLLVANGRKGR